MALKCDICGKKKTIGRSGAHQYGGGWAMRAQKTKKVWKPNLQNYTVDGKKMKLCTRCIKRIKADRKQIKADVKQIKADGKSDKSRK